MTDSLGWNELKVTCTFVWSMESERKWKWPTSGGRFVEKLVVACT